MTTKKTDATVALLNWNKPKSVCTCGRTGDGPGSEHGGITGHGGAEGCFKFTWAGWTPEFEAVFKAAKGRAS